MGVAKDTEAAILAKVGRQMHKCRWWGVEESNNSLNWYE